MRRRAWLVVGGLVAVGIGLFVLRPADPPRDAATEAAQAGTDATTPNARRAAPDPSHAAVPGGAVVARNAAAGSAAPAALPATALPLPSPDTPIASILADLERRARAGDPRAACRLAAELGRCATLARRQASAFQPQQALIQPGTAQPDPAQVERFVDFAARQQVELERDQALCAGVPAERLREATPWLYAAARGGSEAARVVFVTGAWTMVDPYAMRHADVLAAYSRDAERMALASVEGGSPEMLRMLGMAYASRDSRHALGGVVDPDPVRAHALLRLLLDQRPAGTTGAPAPPRSEDGTRVQRLPEQRAYEEIDAGLDPAQRATSDATYARLAARRAEYQARQPQSPRPSRFINSIVQPDACDR